MEEEVMEGLEQEVRCTADGRRLDVQLSEVSGLTRSRVASLMESGCCQVDGKTVLKPGAKARPGQEVCLMIPAARPAAPEPEDIPLHILYEDADVAVVEKPAGMVVHPAAGNETGTLVNALLFHLDHLGSIGGEIRPGIVHRLDKDTSGLLLVAKHDNAQVALSRAFAERSMEKHYIALVEGVMKEDHGRIEAAIARSKTDRKKMVVDENGRSAVTEWRVIGQGKDCTLLDVHILTGRTHQIRVHMRYIHHPVCGDVIYGYASGVKVSRLMLHAYSLDFTHPVTGESMHMVCPLPPAFEDNLRKCHVETWPV